MTQQYSVSLVELKDLAIKHLKPDSTLRNLLLQEPDYLPRREAELKIGIFLKLLRQELNNKH